MAQKLIVDVPWRELGKEPGYYSVYYDALVHDTTLLTLVSRHFPAQTKAVPAALLDQFGERISRNEYHSLSAANMIRAMDLYDAQVAANGDIKVRVRMVAPRASASRAFSTTSRASSTQPSEYSNAVRKPAFSRRPAEVSTTVGRLYSQLTQLPPWVDWARPRRPRSGQASCIVRWACDST